MEALRICVGLITLYGLTRLLISRGFDHPLYELDRLLISVDFVTLYGLTRPLISVDLITLYGLDRLLISIGLIAPSGLTRPVHGDAALALQLTHLLLHEFIYLLVSIGLPTRPTLL